MGRKHTHTHTHAKFLEIKRYKAFSKSWGYLRQRFLLPEQIHAGAVVPYLPPPSVARHIFQRVPTAPHAALPLRFDDEQLDEFRRNEIFPGFEPSLHPIRFTKKNLERILTFRASTPSRGSNNNVDNSRKQNASECGGLLALLFAPGNRTTTTLVEYERNQS